MDEQIDTTESEAVTLNAMEIRLLGCLIEKQATTPDIYPLTVNAAQSAANQKTSRDPIMNLSSGDTHYTLKQLTEKKFARHVSSSRADRYEHRIEAVFGITRPQMILLSLLMLRGGQTLAELQQRSERMHEFATPEDVEYQLERLAAKNLVGTLPRRSGQRGERYMHLLAGPLPESDNGHDEEWPVSSPSSTSTAARITALEERVEALEAQLISLLSSGDASASSSSDQPEPDDSGDGTDHRNT